MGGVIGVAVHFRRSIGARLNPPLQHSSFKFNTKRTDGTVYSLDQAKAVFEKNFVHRSNTINDSFVSRRAMPVLP